MKDRMERLGDLLAAQERQNARRRQYRDSHQQAVGRKPKRELKRVGKVVRCTRCDTKFYAHLSKVRRLREQPCTQIDNRGRACGGRLRLATWAGFLPPEETLRPFHDD